MTAPDELSGRPLGLVSDADVDTIATRGDIMAAVLALGNAIERLERAQYRLMAMIIGLAISLMALAVLLGLIMR
jgi:hypothetical protein